MRKLSIGAAIVALGLMSAAYVYPLLLNWQILTSQAVVKFSMLAHGQTLVGSFSQLAGKISFDPEKLETANFACEIPISTIETGNPKRNEHLQAARWFDAAQFPAIKMTSESVTKNENGGFTMKAKLEIKGVGQDISFPFQFEQASESAGIFKGSFQIKRTDFGVGKEDNEVGDPIVIQLEVPVQIEKN